MVAARRTLRSIDIAGIDPDQPDLLILPPVKLGHSGYRARGHRMIASKHDRNFARLQSFQHLVGVFGTGRGDLFQIFGVRVPFLLLLGNRDGNIATVLHHMAEGFQTSLQTSHADRRWSHIYAAPRLSQVERYTGHPNLLGNDAGERCRGWCHGKF